MKYSLFIIFLLFSLFSVAQISPDCSTAIPICNNTPVNSGTDSYGIDDFNGANESGCLEKSLSGAIESNSAWYRFRTGASGQLGFNISMDSSEDWDFALYKSADCNNLGEPVRCNFKENDDQDSFLGVGEDPTGNTENLSYEDWLDVVPGEDYYLLINNFSNINSGFSIQFSGNIFVTNPYDALDCTIINNLLGPPIAACESDFIELDATTANVLSYDWYVESNSGFDQIIGENNATFEVVNSGLYRVVVTLPGETIISDVQVNFTPNPTASPVDDKVVCYSEDTYDLAAIDAEVLGSQSSDRFIVSYHSNFSDAVSGVNNLNKNHKKNQGVETIYIRVNSFENPKCFDVSQNFDLIVSEEIEQDFPSIVSVCEGNTTVIVGDDTPNNNFTYEWSTGENTPSILVNSEGFYTVTISSIISGVVCSEVFTVDVIISRTPIISNVIIESLQENNTVTIETEFDGNFEYRIDDGEYQTESFFNTVLPGSHIIEVRDIEGCGSVTESIVVMGFSKFFTPNGDGINDQWLVEGLDQLNSPVVLIFDRYGKLMKQLNPLKISWDGFYNGVQMPASDYWFQLSYLEENGDRTVAKYINSHFSLKR
ncbi:T9SS type B sorting domain-containing protein [Cellulophaga sp. HaHaR_3_176]|uniref:T9SS type B sorting domain-containing protein n=1 Tax=Cellulophaga sp. HaHaR_3_176 TaxID=1942464 RepID=UPI001C1FFA9B|nr:T9SS type B sorting domain-containing protein [Cellulophaga sp. HaHaR_3_176]QWX82859.1 T9SS type B sorting domain-containing protein [Cellulophaga sp. HaHaR_3_176]